MTSAALCIGRIKHSNESLTLNNEPIPWADKLKYLGITFDAKYCLQVNPINIKKKFYGALNSILSKSRGSSEPVKLQLVYSFCLPILVYSIGALNFKYTTLNHLSICWNNAFRAIFGYSSWESVKELQYFCGYLDIKHLYDLYRFKFLLSVGSKLPGFVSFFDALELQHHRLAKLRHKYSCSGANIDLMTSAITDHFNKLVNSSTDPVR